MQNRVLMILLGIVIILLVVISAPTVGSSVVQRGGFDAAASDAILPDPPMANDSFLEVVNTIQRPLTTDEKEKVKTVAQNINDNERFVQHTETVAKALKKNVTEKYKQDTLSEQQQVLNILAESQKHIDTLKISMDRSKTILMNLSAKIQSTDISSAESIRKLISCPVCPLTEPGIMNYTDISNHHYRNK